MPGYCRRLKLLALAAIISLTLAHTQASAKEGGESGNGGRGGHPREQLRNSFERSIRQEEESSSTAGPLRSLILEVLRGQETLFWRAVEEKRSSLGRYKSRFLMELGQAKYLRVPSEKGAAPNGCSQSPERATQALHPDPIFSVQAKRLICFNLSGLSSKYVTHLELLPALAHEHLHLLQPRIVAPRQIREQEEEAQDFAAVFSQFVLKYGPRLTELFETRIGIPLIPSFEFYGSFAVSPAKTFELGVTPETPSQDPSVGPSLIPEEMLFGKFEVHAFANRYCGGFKEVLILRRQFSWHSFPLVDEWVTGNSSGTRYRSILFRKLYPDGSARPQCLNYGSPSDFVNSAALRADLERAIRSGYLSPIYRSDEW